MANYERGNVYIRRQTVTLELVAGSRFGETAKTRHGERRSRNSTA